MYVYWIRSQEHKDILTEGYVGITNTPSKRFSEHKGSKRKVGKAIRKHSIETCEVIFEGTEEECIAKEIELRPSDGIGWNTTKGGGLPPTTFSKTKGHVKSEAARKGWTEERRAKQSEFMRGNKITPHETSSELRQKRSEIAKQRMSDPVNRARISQKLTGRKRGKYIMAKENLVVACPHCGKTGKMHGGMKTWHFDKCKSNPARAQHTQHLIQQT